MWLFIAAEFQICVGNAAFEKLSPLYACTYIHTVYRNIGYTSTSLSEKVAICIFM